MFDHLSLGVRDLAAARRFYDAFFGPLGVAISLTADSELFTAPLDRVLDGDAYDAIVAERATDAAARAALTAALAAERADLAG